MIGIVMMVVWYGMVWYDRCSSRGHRAHDRCSCRGHRDGIALEVIELMMV